MMRRIALLFLCALFLSGCGQARRVYQVGLLAMEVPKAMMASKDSHDDKSLAAESVTVNLILNIFIFCKDFSLFYLPDNIIDKLKTFSVRGLYRVLVLQVDLLLNTGRFLALALRSGS